MIYAGIDIGTSGIKLALTDDNDGILASAARKLDVSRPHPGWSEQHPEIWRQATEACFDELASSHPELLSATRGIGLSGQMLGPVLIDKRDRPVRAAILWNDLRATEESAELLRRVPDIGQRTNGNPDPGLTAPKLIWLASHEPKVLDSADCLMLPKDYVRLGLTGERATEPSDAAGTMLMDCRARYWADDLCHAANWSRDRLPPIVQSWEPAGGLRPELARRWKMRAGLPVAGGAGDNMACSIGLGAARAGDAVISIGTSGVICIVDEIFRPAAEQAVLTNPHAAPATYLSMGVVMSATASLDWLADLSGAKIGELAGEIDAFYATGSVAQAPVMRPSLSGVRTPHNRPDMLGAISGLGQGTNRAMLGWAVLEGVTFQFKECLDAQKGAGVHALRVSLAGGGAKNVLWCRMIASLLDMPVTLPYGRDVAASLGAARLAQVAADDASPTERLAMRPEQEFEVQPDLSLQRILIERYSEYLNLSK